MKTNKLFSLLPIIGMALAATPILAFKANNKVKNNFEFAKPGQVAYAASYSDSVYDEPNFSTQRTKTFQYLNLGSALSSYRGDSVKVGIIDSGINYNHEDFMVNNETKVQGDSKYYAYESSGWVYYGASSHGYSYINDTLGHGTNVAATVAAAINKVGGAGLAPNVELYIYKVTNSNNGYEFGAIQNALLNAKTLGLDVINMSFQSYENAVDYGSSHMDASSGCSTILTYYLNLAYNAGITLVGAAGNYNTDEPSYPGSNNHVINVGSLNSDGTGKAPFSNYGSTIDLVAPGYVYVADESSDSAYTNTSGTSFSAPLVTAAIALYKQKNPNATPSEIETALYASCDEIDDSGSEYTNWAGNGALNVAKFLQVEDTDPQQIKWTNVENDELSLEVGDEFQLECEVLPTTALNKTVHYQVDTELSDDGVVTVTDSGLVSAVGVGTAFVEVYSDEITSINNYVEITVTSKTRVLSSISVKTAPTKLTYIEGQYFDPTGLVLTLNYNDETSETVSYASSSSNFSFNPSISTALTTSNTSISITYGGKSCSQAITVNSKTLQSITLSNKTTSYYVGDTFVKPTVTANYDNGTSTDVTGSTTFSGYDLSTAGDYTVTASYGGKTATYDITVAASSSTTVNFAGGTFEKSQITWKTVDNHVTVIQNKGDGANDVSSSYISSPRIYKGHYLSFTSDNGYKIAKIELTYNGSYYGNSMTAGVAISGTTVTDNTSLVARTWATANSGTHVVSSVSSSGLATIYIQNVASNSNVQLRLTSIKITYAAQASLVSISVTNPQTKYMVGDTFVKPTVTATYSDSTSGDVTSSAIFTGYNMSTAGEQEVVVSYTHNNVTKTTSYSIQVIQLTSISISGYKTSFVEGDSFSFGGTVTANYSDETSENVTNKATYAGYNMTSVGEQTVTVTYGGLEKSYSISISKGTLVSITLSGQTTVYTKNAAFSFDGTVTAHFENNYSKSVTGYSTSSPDMTTAGSKTVTVSYTYNNKTVSESYSITVNSYRDVYEDVVTSIYCTYDFSTLSGSSEITTTDDIQACYSDEGGITTGSVTNRSKTYANSGYIRLATGSSNGSITFDFGETKITNISLVAKGWSSSEKNCTLSITNGGTITTSKTTDESFNVTLSSSTSTITISANSDNRISIKNITFYSTKTVNTNIGQSNDCTGLETFINNFMHMDYNSNLGYCKDSEHHYYATAKEAFNNLNDHQRQLFTTNSAYLAEFTRLSTWASFNGDSLNNTTNKFEQFHGSDSSMELDSSNVETITIVILSITTISFFALLIYKKKKKV